MARTYYQNHAHIVFSTKNREPFINSKIETAFHAYLAGIVKKLSGHPCVINGMPDHIHILARTSSTISAADFMRDLKANSAKWIKPTVHGFAWQGGYGWFSVSSSQIPAVTGYIRAQKTHHRKTTFQEEYLAFLKRNDIEYNERYLWE